MCYRINNSALSTPEHDILLRYGRMNGNSRQESRNQEIRNQDYMVIMHFQTYDLHSTTCLVISKGLCVYLAFTYVRQVCSKKVPRTFSTAERHEEIEGDTNLRSSQEEFRGTVFTVSGEELKFKKKWTSMLSLLQDDQEHNAMRQHHLLNFVAQNKKKKQVILRDDLKDQETANGEK